MTLRTALQDRWRAEPMRWGWLILCAVLFVTYFVTPGVFKSKLAGDGWWHYAYVRSLMMDGDLDFTPDAPHLPWQKQRSAETGRITNPYGVGAPLLWAPFFVAGRGVNAIHRSLDPSVRADGYDRFTPKITVFGSLFWAVLGLWLCYRMLLTWFTPRTAFAGIVALYLASNLALFTLLHPGYSHACSMFAVSALVYAWHRGRGSYGLARWGVLGALVGLATLVRSQNVLFAALPAAEALVAGVGAVRERDRARILVVLRAGAVATFAAVLCFTPQMLVWSALYGSPLTVPQGEGDMVWGQFGVQSVLGALFWSKNGLTPWTPVLCFALLGLVHATLRHPRLLVYLWLGFGLQLWLNASNIDIEGGWSFGQRKFINCFIIFAFGFVWALDRARQWLEYRPDLTPKLALGAVIAMLIALNVGLMVRLSRGEQKVARPLDMRPVYTGAARAVMDGVWEITGNPAAFPAPWIYWLFYDVPPERFDRVVGRFLLYQRPYDPRHSKPSYTFNFARPRDRDLVLEGVVNEAGSLAPRDGRPVRVLLPLWFQRHGARLTLRFAAPAAVGVRLNGEECPVEGSVVTLAADRINWGINQLEISAPAPFEVIGMRIDTGATPMSTP